MAKVIKLLVMINFLNLLFHNFLNFRNSFLKVVRILLSKVTYKIINYIINNIFKLYIITMLEKITF